MTHCEILQKAQRGEGGRHSEAVCLKLRRTQGEELHVQGSCVGGQKSESIGSDWKRTSFVSVCANRGCL